MPDLLIELLSEEIPARMQQRAAEDLRALVTNALVDAGLVYEGAMAFAGPRRLVLAVEGIPASSPQTREERKGPRIDAPEKALAGFARSAGLDSLEACEIRQDKKGNFYVAVITKPGQPAPVIIASVIEVAVRRFPWPKSMRWGTGTLRWVRPLHGIVATLSTKGGETEVVPLSIDGIESSDVTRGHATMAPGPITVARFDDYAASLFAAKVEIDGARRREIILAYARDLAFAQGLELVEDEALADEVAGLVEWPVVLMGRLDPDFLALPRAVLTSSMRDHQKYFALQDPETKELAPRFIVVANIEASDGGKAIVAGNERVLTARLADARFFWDQDLQTPLGALSPKLEKVTFHKRLGNQAQRVTRITELALAIADKIDADRDEIVATRRAAELCKSDLVTQMVGEFPDLQGHMGRVYATEQNETDAVAAAIEEHYRPQGPGDAVPTGPVSIAVALADKLDTLAGFWAIDEKPTGSKDPFALRRAALGVIRIILENKLRLELARITTPQFELIEAAVAHVANENRQKETSKSRNTDIQIQGNDVAISVSRKFRGELVNENSLDLLTFFADRLKVYLKDAGTRHDLIDAVFASGQEDDLLMAVARVEALTQFLKTSDGADLLAGIKRVQNILSKEEKNDGRPVDGVVDQNLLLKNEEKSLDSAIRTARGQVIDAVKAEDFTAALSALAQLRGPVDRFFDNVTVNADNPDMRTNRLKMLAQIRDTTARIADFSVIVG